jgi:hypothetical protein
LNSSCAKLRLLLFAVSGPLIFRALAGQSPVIHHTIPLAVQPGKSTQIRFVGENLASVTGLWTSFSAQATPISNGGSNANKEISFELSIPPGPLHGIGAIRLAGTNGISDFQWILFDSNPAIPNVGANNTMATAQRLILPSAIDGLATEVTSHFFQFTLAKGQRVAIEVLAARIGSSMDPVLRLLDVKGRELAYSEDRPELGTDARIDFTAVNAGDYVLELRDTRYQGGARFFYRLSVADSIESNPRRSALSTASIDRKEH